MFKGQRAPRGLVDFERLGLKGALTVPEPEVPYDKMHAKTIIHDIIVIELSENLASLDFPLSDCEVSQDVFLVGYPSETANRSQYKARDAVKGGLLLNTEGGVCGMLSGILPMSEEFDFDTENERYMMFSYGRTLQDLRDLFE